MPRRSAAAEATRPVSGAVTRLKPPASLAGPARVHFANAVGSVDAQHFTAADIPLLVEFARATALADDAAAELAKSGAVVGGRASPWLTAQEKAQRALVALSARLRLCPQSRFDRTTAGTRSRNPGPAGLDQLRQRYAEGD